MIMDYIRIKSTSQRVNESASRGTESQSRKVTEPTANCQQPTANDIRELLKDWIKLYPDSFAPDVEFKIYQIEDGDIIIQLHEDMSSLAVSLLVLYLETTRQQVNETTSIDSESQRRRDAKSVSELISQSSIANSQQPIAYITIDDTEVLLKQNIGKRAMLFCESTRQQVNETTSRDTETQRRRDAKSVSELISQSSIANSQQPISNSQWPTSVRFILEDNYVLDYDFERKPQPVKDSGLQFEEMKFALSDDYEVVRVGDVIKKKIDEVLESEELTPKKMMWYLICGAVGLAIGMLIVYLTGM